MERKKPIYFEDVEDCVNYLIDYLDKDIKIESPLGLGKPVALLNALYRRAKQDPDLKLTIISALSLEKPMWSNELQRRLIKPLVDRVWFGVPDLLYLKDIRSDCVPDNVSLYEFYCRAGQYVTQPMLQQNYISSNYTHIGRDAEAIGANVFANMIAKCDSEKKQSLSMSCSADLSLQTLKRHNRAKAKGAKRLCIGQINANLPFMYGDAQLSSELYDIIIDHSRYNHPLFASPRQPISITDYMIGMNVSALIKDGGTLQMGLGSLGDAIAYALDMRHNFNEAYQSFFQQNDMFTTYEKLIGEYGGLAPFKEGLYGLTEMLTDGFLQLHKSGVIKRKVYHHAGIQRLLNQQKISPEISFRTLKVLLDEGAIPGYLSQNDFESLQRVGIFKKDLIYDKGQIKNGEKIFTANLNDESNLEEIAQDAMGSELINGVLLTGGFFIGPQDFYETLRKMPEKERRQFEMTGVEVTNQLYGNEELRSLQRKDARFCNSCMKATILGHIVSDGLEDGTVISGVGGQYNFASMSHALPDARLIMMIKSTRTEKGRLSSNIVYNYGNITIPRHLRDIVVTEYGIANLRGLCDKEVIMAMLNITDSRYQKKLLRQAKKHRKIPSDYRIPDQYCNNLPQRLKDAFRPFKAKGYFLEFPHGTDFSPIEFGIARSLKLLNQKFNNNKLSILTNILKEIPNQAPEKAMIFIERMQLDKPKTLKEKIMQKTMVLSLRLSGLI